MSSRREYRPVSLSTGEVEQLSAVRSLGMYIADLPPRLYGEIRRSAMRQFEELKQGQPQILACAR